MSKGAKNNSKKQFTSFPKETFDIVSVNKANIREFIPRPIDIKCKTANQTRIIKAIDNNQIIFITGDAGTGKTHVSLLHCINLLLAENQYAKINLTKSITTLKNEEMGFLPGTLEEKFEPYLWAFKGIMSKYISNESINSLTTGMNKIVEPLPLAFIRGMTIENSLMIIEEAQNLGGMTNFETILTRIGENSKLIFVGDEKQIDLKRKSESFFSKITKKFEEVKIPGIAVVRLTRDDIVRNKIIIELEKVLDEIREEEKRG